MSTISSSISALASSVTNDLYAPLAGKTAERDGPHLLRAGRAFSVVWGVLLTAAALGFAAWAGGKDTPTVVLALSIASITYGPLLGSFVLAGWGGSLGQRLRGGDVVIAVVISLALMAAIVLAKWLAFVWTVPLGAALTIGLGLLASTLRRRPA
jgi:Na+/proline symporter